MQASTTCQASPASVEAAAAAAAEEAYMKVRRPVNVDNTKQKVVAKITVNVELEVVDK